MVSYEKKIVFDIEVMPHLFVLSCQCLRGYERYGSPKTTHSVREAYEMIRKTEDCLWVGYYSNGYDDYIMSAIVENEGYISPEELSKISTELIEKGEKPYRKCFISYDCFDPIEAGMRSLKMFCGSSGRPTYDSPYSFKDDVFYNEKEIAEIEKYCEEDVSYTVEVFQNEKDYYEASLARVDILADAGVEVANPLKAICCRSAAFGRYLFQSMCPKRDIRDNSRSQIRFVRDYTTSPYKEVQEAYAYYKQIQEDCDELSDVKSFYDKEKTPTFAGFQPGLDVNLGWGGAHGALSGYIFKENEHTALRYVDVSSMYPTLLVMHDLFPYTFTQDAKGVYEFVYRSRLTYKANGDAVKSQAAKRVIASLTGMLKDQFATFRAEWSNNSIVVNGQLSILDLACRLRDMGWVIVQVNTDGVMVETPNDEDSAAKFERIYSRWCEDYKFEVSAKLISVLIQTNVNNYYMKLNTGKEDLKGAAYSYNERYFRDKVVVRKALVDCLNEGISAGEALERYRDIKDYFVLIKTTDTFPYLWDILSDEKKEARCIRLLGVKKDVKKVIDAGFDFCYYIKARRKGSTSGDKVTNYPDYTIELPSDIGDYNNDTLMDLLDKDYYIAQINRAIEIFHTGE